MNVSFGRIRTYTEKRNPGEGSDSLDYLQKQVKAQAMRAFGPNEKIPFRYGYDKTTGLEYSLSEALEKVKNADVCILSKRNGNVEIKIVKTIPGTENDETPKRYVPCESYENKLKLEVNPRAQMRNLNNILKKFAQRCEYYLRNGDGKINKRIEAELLADKNQGIKA